MAPTFLQPLRFNNWRNLAGLTSISPKCCFGTVNAKQFRQRIQETAARRSQEAAERAAKKKPPSSATSKPSPESFRQHIQDIVQRHRREADEAAARKKPPASEKLLTARRKAK